MRMMGWGYVQNTQVLFRAEIIPLKHNFWSFLAISFAVFQIQMISILITLQYDMMGCDMCKTLKFYSDSLKTPFLAVFGYNNCSVSNPNDFNTHTSSL